jgi:hypothetical protein
VSPSAAAKSKHPAAYRHTKRKDWGLATLAWERDGKRGFKFEDGTERAFPIEFCHLLEIVEGAVVVPTTAAAAAESTIQLVFDDQVALMREQFPGGFEDPQWLTNYRGTGRKRPLKRHRDGSIAVAQEKLGLEPFTAMMEAQAWDDIRDAAAAVAGATDLVSKTHCSSLVEARATETMATALFDLLHSETRSDHLFDKFCRALASTGAKASSWPLATVFSALIHPTEHVCVRSRVLQRQAELLRVPGRASSPTARGYRWSLSLAQRVRDELTERGVPPRDFLDVYDFCWLTLRPAAMTDLVRLAHGRISAAPLDADDEETFGPAVTVVPADPNAGDDDDDDDDDDDAADEDES